jgi:prepilin-type N-terminal cleavage/methylation domain-containing protein
MRAPGRFALFLLAGFTTAGPASAQTTVELNVFNFGFGTGSPPVSFDPTIHPGDTIHWTWSTDFHSVTTVSGSADPFDSGIHNTGFTFSHTFNTVGSFAYYCSVHGFDNGDGTAGGMAGRIMVVPVPEPTSVLLIAGLAGGTVAGVGRRRRARARMAGLFRDRPPRTGFTLIELLVSLSIIVLLTGLSLSAVQKVRASAGYTACRNNLKQIGLAINLHETQFGYYPGVGVEPVQTSALVPLLPFLEQESLSKGLTPDRPLFWTVGDYVWLRPDRTEPARTVVSTFLCPSDGMPAVTTGFDPNPVAGTNYFANAGTGTGSNFDFRYPTDGVFWYGSKVRRKDVVDGISSTIFFAEALRGAGKDQPTIPSEADSPRFWMSPSHMVWPNADRVGTTPPFSDATCGTSMLYMDMRGDRGASWVGGPGQRSLFNTYLMPNDPMMDCGTFGLGRFKAASGHAGGANMVLGDGSVHFIKNHIDLATWRALSTRNDNEVIGSYCGCH